jgi:hypothetical protein
MKRKLVSLIVFPIIAWVAKKITEKIAVTKEQHAAREKVAPSV